jgi:hypothetical protein
MRIFTFVLKGLLIFLVCVHGYAVFGQVGATVDSRVDSIAGLLTLEDCINLLAGVPGMQAPGIPALHIPSLRMTDGPNGPHWETAPGFPVGICLAESWDTTPSESQIIMDVPQFIC